MATSLTGMSRSGPAYWPSVRLHCRACLPRRHDGSCAAMNSSAIAPKAGAALGGAVLASALLGDGVNAVNADHLAQFSVLDARFGQAQFRVRLLALFSSFFNVLSSTSPSNFSPRPMVFGGPQLHQVVRANRRDFLLHRIARHFRRLPPKGLNRRFGDSQGQCLARLTESLWPQISVSKLCAGGRPKPPNFVVLDARVFVGGIF